jgi:sensor domain CHASE-containing protein
MTPKARLSDISVASVISLIPVLTVVWFIVKPSIVKAVGDELQEQVQQTVAKEVRPINRALTVILGNNADNLERQIAAMEFRRDFPPDDDWSNEDAQVLAQLKLDLRSAKAAKAALKDDDDPS